MVEAIESELSFRKKHPSGLNRSYNGSDFRASIFSEKEELTDVEKLEKKLEKINKEQGIFQKAFNEVKEGLNIGTSNEKCEGAIEKFKNGEITYEEAEAEIEGYDVKQDSGLNVFANILCSIAAVAVGTLVTVATCGAAAPAVVGALAVAAGAGAGAVTKAGVKVIDRSTNKVQGDDFEGKEIARDMLSGAVTGATAAATMGTGSAATTAGSVAKTTILSAVKAGAKEGAITGAVAGGANYAIDCAIDGEEFNLGDFAKTTAENAVIGGIAGGTISGTCHGYSSVIRGSKPSITTPSVGRTIGRRAFATTRAKLLNKTIRDVA